MERKGELSKQARIVEKATKYEKERKSIINDNAKLHNEVEQIKNDYKQKEFDLKYNYQATIRKLEKENSYLHKVIDKFKSTINIFIKWICKKFDMGAENNLIRDFEKENHISLDAEKQVHKEEKEKEWDLER